MNLPIRSAPSPVLATPSTNNKVTSIPIIASPGTLPTQQALTPISRPSGLDGILYGIKKSDFQSVTVAGCGNIVHPAPS